MRGEGEVSKEKSCVEKKFSLAKLRGYNNIAKGRGETKGSSFKVASKIVGRIIIFYLMSGQVVLNQFLFFLAFSQTAPAP